MYRRTLIGFLIAASSAWGETAAPENPGVTEYIIHHVSDSSEYEFEVPLRPDKNIVILLPVWRIPLKAGACPNEPNAREKSASLSAGCLDLSPTKHVVMMWISALLLIGAFFLGAHRNKQQWVPRGVTSNLIEMLVLFVRDEIAEKTIGKKDAPRFTPYLLTIFFFILFMNWLGLIPWMSTATGNLAVTCGLALCTFAVTQVASIRAAGVGNYFKHLTGGVAWWLWPIMVPVEILGLFTKPFALTVRLFANMLAGHMVIFSLLGLIFLINHAAVALISVPFAMGIYFLEIFVGLVQAYVFTLLSSVFIGMGVAMADHGSNEEHHAAQH